MAITRYGIDGDLNILKTAIDASEVFAATSVDDNVLTISDAEEAKIKITKESTTSWTISVKLANGTWHNITTVTGTELNYAWITNGGIFLNLQGSSDYAPVLLAVTNTGAYAVAMTNVNGYGKTSGLIAVSTDDTDGSSLDVFSFVQAARTYTTMIPFTTETGTGTPSYTPTAFYMPFTSVSASGYTRIVLDGKLYLTEGHWAILDGDL